MCINQVRGLYYKWAELDIVYSENYSINQRFQYVEIIGEVYNC